MSEPQANEIARIYGPRAATYSETWHALHAKDFINHADLQPGQHVLDLACGTGLFAIPAARVVGKTGSIVGVDITDEMLAIAKERAAKDGAAQAENLVFVHGDMSRLEAVRLPDGRALPKDAYDLIVSASAVPLLPNPMETIKTWMPYLKPSVGRLIFDVPTEKHWLGGLIFETVAKELGIPLANVAGRSTTKGAADLEKLLTGAGFIVEKVFVASGYGSGAKRYEVANWEKEFANWIDTGFVAGLDTQGCQVLREAFQQRFKEYGGKNGWFEDEEGFYIAIGKRP